MLKKEQLKALNLIHVSLLIALILDDNYFVYMSVFHLLAFSLEVLCLFWYRSLHASYMHVHVFGTWTRLCSYCHCLLYNLAFELVNKEMAKKFYLL